MTGINPTHAHGADNAYIGRILHPVNTGRIRRWITAPVAGKYYDAGLEIIFCYLLWHRSNHFPY